MLQRTGLSNSTQPPPLEDGQGTGFTFLPPSFPGSEFCRRPALPMGAWWSNPTTLLLRWPFSVRSRSCVEEDSEHGMWSMTSHATDFHLSDNVLLRLGSYRQWWTTVSWPSLPFSSCYFPKLWSTGKSSRSAIDWLDPTAFKEKLKSLVNFPEAGTPTPQSHWQKGMLVKPLKSWRWVVLP